MAPMVVGVNGVASGAQGLGKALVAAGVLGHAVGDLDHGFGGGFRVWLPAIGKNLESIAGAESKKIGLHRKCSP